MVEDSEKASNLMLMCINSDKPDASTITENDIFKIMVPGEGEAEENAFLSVEANNKSENLLDDQSFSDRKNVKIGEQYRVNTYDAFKVIIPKEDEYMELSLCLDSREYIDSFFGSLVKASDIQSFITERKEGFAMLFIQLLEFMWNKLNGKTRAEYGIGEIVPHRQEMVSKVGILQKMFDFLEVVNEVITDDNQDEILADFELNEDGFEDFEN